MLKLPKKEWLTRFAGTPLESISEWVRYYYINPVDYSYNDDGNIIKIDDVIGVVDLGDLEFEVASAEYHTFYATIPGMKAFPTSAENIYLYSLLYTIDTRGMASMANMTMRQYNANVNNVVFKNESYNSASDFKEAMKGKELIYLKA